MNKKLCIRIAIALVIGVTFNEGASAQIIGVDFNLGGSTDQSPAPSDVVGPVPAAGWVNLENLSAPPTYITNNTSNPSDHGSPVALNDTTGAATPVLFGFNNFGFSTLNGSTTYSPDYGALGAPDSGLTSNQQLYNGAAYAAGGGYSQEVSLIDVPYAQYDVYLLVSASGPEGIGSITSYTDYNPSTSTATLGLTYWFSSDASFAIPSSDFSFVQATGTSQGTATLNATMFFSAGLPVRMWSSTSPLLCLRHTTRAHISPAFKSSQFLSLRHWLCSVQPAASC